MSEQSLKDIIPCLFMYQLNLYFHFHFPCPGAAAGVWCGRGELQGDQGESGRPQAPGGDLGAVAVQAPDPTLRHPQEGLGHGSGGGCG